METIIKTYRTAIVGLTGIAAKPRIVGRSPTLGYPMPNSHAAAYATIPNTNIVAVCDLVPDLIERFRNNWGDVFPDARGYSDYRKMFANQEIDLLTVATSDHRHARIVIDAALAGVKGIICEKPIATTLADADEMIDTCAKQNVALLIDHNRRWSPEHVEARHLIRNGEIGRLQTIIASLGGPRAMLFRNGTHLIDMVCFFAESNPDWLVSELEDANRDYPPRYSGDGGHDPATDPGTSTYVHFENGLRAFVTLEKDAFQNFEIDLIGEKGRIRIGRWGGEVWRPVGTGEMAVSQLSNLHTTKSDLVAAIEELIRLVEFGGTGSSSGEDGRKVLSILLASLQSNAANNSPVRFPIHDI